MKTSFLRKFLKDIDDLPDQPTRERLAVLIEGDAVEFARVVHRKTIYDVFP